MKTNYLPLLLALLCLSICVNIYQSIPKTIEDNNFDNPVIIWNDDLESIPMDNTPVLLEFSSKNSDTLYIGPLEPNPAEYRFTVTDDSISVSDFDRKVGTVKIEGQLKELIDQDNE